MEKRDREEKLKEEQSFSVFGEYGHKLLSFEECMERINFRQSIYTFRRRLDEVIEEFGGPVPPLVGHLTFLQLGQLMQRLEELGSIKRQRKQEKKASQKAATAVSNF
ncbi:MAG: hypothetical protein K2Q26_03945 [Bdellovibrionales bacterium]|nr:hypothetical protein [Bdellovibrionales bacterium]